VEVKDLKLSEIRPYENNPRNNDEAVEYVANSIKEFGFKVPIVVDSEGVIVAGHTRYKAAKQLGLESVPCVVADDLTDEQVKAFRIADNKVAEIATWDYEALNIELGEIIGIDMEDFGFSELEFDEDHDEIDLVDEDEYTDQVDDPICKKGDIWMLGEHRLMCGDSTDAEQVYRLMNGEKADMLLTDPPYNVSLGYNMSVEEAKALNRRTDGLVVENDSFNSPEEFQEFLLNALKNAEQIMRDGAAFYVWHSSNWAEQFFTASRKAGLRIRQCLVWNKNTFAMGRQDYQWKHEPCLYGWKEGAAHYFIDDRTQSTVFEDSKPDIKKMKKSEMQQLLEKIFSDKVSTTIIDEDKPSRSEEHPTMKPLKLMGRQIANSSKKGWIILDLFGGSGSTMMACEQLGRRCYTMEIDPHYCDVIIDRWQRLTGKTAVKESATFTA
jgi:site-specific DNA-methyltransferase (adenine-specific)